MISIGSKIASVQIAERGAEVTAWRVHGRDLLWPGDPAWWDEQSPLLFPVVGWTRGGEVRVAGRTYPLGLHGFARRATFAVDDVGPDFARLSLTDDAASRALYPFAFALTVTYRIAESELAMEAVIVNTGSSPMPYAFGFHPGFR